MMTRRQRDRQLRDNIALAATMGRPNHAHRIMRSAIELAREQSVNDDKRRRLVHALAECLNDDTETVALDGNDLYINGTFDVRELAKRMVW